MDDTPFYAGSSAGASAPGDRLALLYHLSQTFSSSLDLDEVLNRVMDEVIVVTRAERGFVMLRADSGELVFHVARGIDQQTVEDPGFQISLSVVEMVAENGQAVLTSDAQMDPRWNMRQSVRLLGLRSILCVPLKLQERILGIIYVDNRIQAGIFSKDDQELLTAIASSASVAIENARLYKVAVEKGSLERELQMARQVQIDLIPQEIPQIQGWEFATRWLPARQVAGDFLDFIFNRDGKMGIVVADVSDKGMPAALFMALSRSTLRASMDASSSPGEGMYRANCLIQADSQSGMFVTMVYALLEPGNGNIRYINAGHNPPLLYQNGMRRGQGSLRRLERTGMAVGVLPDMNFEEKPLLLQPRDFVVFYTDGITDALNEQGQDFGMQGLESLVLEQREHSANQIAAALEDALRTHIGDQPLFDDITLVIARRI